MIIDVIVKETQEVAVSYYHVTNVRHDCSGKTLTVYSDRYIDKNEFCIPYFSPVTVALSKYDVKIRT